MERSAWPGGRGGDAAAGERGVRRSVGVIRDPFGHRWFVATAIEPDDVPVEDVPGRRYGDVGYVTLEVPDGDRQALLQRPVRMGDAGGYQPSRSTSSITPPSGIHGQEGAPEVRLFFRSTTSMAAAE